MSNLVEHARKELEMIYKGKDPWFVDGCVKVIQAFADMGHSGGSASVAIPTINDLLQFKNLTPLTDNPDEWIYYDENVWGKKGGIWQNRRNSKAFSNDEGKTYYLISEDGNDKHRGPMHTSIQHIKEQ